MTYSPEQIDVELSRRGINVPGRPRREYPIEADFRAALVDYVRMANGRAVKDPEPLAREWTRDGLNIAQVREFIGLTSGDFTGLMEDSLGVLMAERFGETAQGIASISRVVELPNYKKAALAEVGIAAPPEIFEEAGPANRLPFEIGDSSDAVLREFGGRVAFSRPLWLTYGAEIGQGIGNYGAVFGLTELRLVAEVIEAGSPPTGSGNIDTTGIAVATTALRNQTNASGQKVNLPISALLVPPALEVAANSIKVLTGMSYAVIVNPYLSSATVWWAFGPSDASPLVRLVLRGNRAPKLFTNPNRQEQGAEFAVNHSVNFLLLDAPGIVEMG